ncbi:MAG: hypothetical protein M5R42_13730 [Rhodocyclaceae bacterium]|nr:hypothetical protein [Rhodocyclaceae bacterium]
MIDWAAIDTVLLDMDGTLLDLNFDNHFWQEHVPVRYAERHGLPHAEARSRLTDIYHAKAGTLDWYCVDYWTRELQLDIARLKEEVSHLIAVHPDVPRFLEALRAARQGRCPGHQRAPEESFIEDGAHRLAGAFRSPHHLARDRPAQGRPGLLAGAARAAALRPGAHPAHRRQPAGAAFSAPGQHRPSACGLLPRHPPAGEGMSASSLRCGILWRSCRNNNPSGSATVHRPLNGSCIHCFLCFSSIVGAGPDFGDLLLPDESPLEKYR